MAGEIPDEAAAAWQDPKLRSGSIAFLQYTSGSTGSPKGVVVSHGNLLNNAKEMHEAFSIERADIGVSWLPLYHDMGLMGGVIQPLYSAYPTLFLSPLSLIERPLQWLETISTARATISGGPNFAYELCAQKASSLRPEALDLSTWRVAFNGSENVRAETLKKFISAFAPHGFRARAFRPCYGLAEATLLVSARNSSSDVTLQVDAEALKERKVRIASEGAHARTLVAAGETNPSHSTAIVDPDTLQLCGENEIGEIWVSGPSVAQGYWEKPEETRHVFEACIANDGSRRYLRTGDLGFQHNGHLFIAGRLKDLIIIRGQNFYPQDIEATVASCHPALQAGRGAAFAVTEADMPGVEGLAGEHLVVVREVSRNIKPGDGPGIIRSIREQLTNEHQLDAHAIVLIRQGSMPRTTSGKVQHKVCRKAFLEGSLKVVASSEHRSGEAEATPPPETRMHGESHDGSLISTYAQLAEAVAGVVKVPAEQLTPDVRLNALGIDSLKAAEIKMAIEKTLGAEVPLSALLQGLSMNNLMSMVQSHVSQCEPAPDSSGNTERPASYPLSAGQKALWYLQQLQPQSSAYTIARAVKITGPLDTAVLERVFTALVQRHASLRMSVAANAGDLLQHTSASQDFNLRVEDARSWNDDVLMSRVAASASVPFSLATGPVLRAELYVRSGQQAVLLLCAHHIALDLWSLDTLTQELLHLYRAFKEGHAPQLQPVNSDYAGFVQWQSALLASPDQERLLNYWRQQIENAPESIALPDQNRHTASDERSVWHFDCDADLRNQLHDFARSQRVTLHGLMQAAFETLLHRYTGQEEFLIGLLSSGRHHNRSKGVVGYFINPLVLRPRFSGNPSFAAYLQASYSGMTQALDHGDLPFSVLVEQLHSHRGNTRSPLFQVMCIFQPAKIGNGPDLSSFVMGRKGGKLEAGNLVFESLEFSEADTQFDLTLVVCDSGEKIAVALKYDPARFDAAFVQRMAGHYQVILRNVMQHPELPAGSISMITDAERFQALAGFNDTAATFRTDACIHTLIEEQVERTPEGIAVTHQQSRLTYRELDTRANQLANYLRGLGVRAESKVGLFLERSTDLVVAMLGILKAGGAYVAMDPAHPMERTLSIVQNSHAALVVTSSNLAQQLIARSQVQCICLDRDLALITAASDGRPESCVLPENLAYVMHTSGSTGRPKGVMIQHQNVINFFAGMSSKIPCGPGDTLLAVTSVSFDISVLELLWTLSCGATVAIADDATLNRGTAVRKQRKPEKGLQFSLFYFASAQTENGGGKYQMLLEGAKLADELGLEAVWTPERHFHDFGGQYSNPSLTSAALAMTTRRVQLRGGSVVLPLHHPVRVAEEWAFVDNISGGRVGVAFASGWHADDFVFAPQHYPARKEIMYRGIDAVRQLWRGDAFKTTGGGGNEVEIRIFPRPIQPELPVWITSAGTAETFEAAARVNANVLTHLLGQELKEVGAKINLYRQGMERAGRNPASGAVTLMLHTYLDKNFDQVRQKALGPFKNYLRSSVSLIANLARSLNLNLDLEKMNERDLDDLLAFAAERYMGTSGLFGAPEACLDLIESVRGLGVTEIACLIDFGIDFASTMQSIHHIAELQRIFNREAGAYAAEETQAKQDATILQCTPSYLRMLMHMESGRQMLASLRMLLVGGEPVPAAVIEEVRKSYQGPILNMYGPTETTIWSGVQPVSSQESQILIGGPIANTQLYILNPDMVPVPIGITGEVYIGGLGLARGYLGAPDLTAERFLPDPYSGISGARLYRTGDLGRLHEDGRIELAGRSDQQVKVRGYRIELGDIEASLNRAPGVGTGVVIKQESDDQAQLVAYLVASNGSIDLNAVRDFLREQLPSHMVPGKFQIVRELPLTANGKINRKALPLANMVEDVPFRKAPIPAGGLQAAVLDVWKQILKTESISIDDNFFDIGGHSLLMVQVHEQLQRLFARNFPLMALLQHPTVRSIAQYLEDSSSVTKTSSAEKAAMQRAALISQRQRALTVRG
jgi:natural product biosynthesis luciferase-like monooxygenase protein